MVTSLQLRLNNTCSYLDEENFREILIECAQWDVDDVVLTSGKPIACAEKRYYGVC